MAKSWQIQETALGVPMGDKPYKYFDDPANQVAELRHMAEAVIPTSYADTLLAIAETIALDHLVECPACSEIALPYEGGWCLKCGSETRFIDSCPACACGGLSVTQSVEKERANNSSVATRRSDST